MELCEEAVGMTGQKLELSSISYAKYLADLPDAGVIATPSEPEKGTNIFHASSPVPEVISISHSKSQPGKIVLITR